VRGNLGVDFLEGNEGGDTLQGGKGSDSLDGGAGNDFLSGERGNDVLTGGAGADTFFFFYGENGTYGVDTLTDFNGGDGENADKIVLAAGPTTPEDASFNALSGSAGGPLPADEFAVVENFNPAAQGDNPAAIIYDPVSGLVYYNPTGTIGDEDQILRVDPNTPLTNTDFEIF
ncbi:MAG: calcium-binding protein, partial [Okeania sp. SIO3B3]|nr:calcium-binding protein [Okeania sp. SIO3B3]